MSGVTSIAGALPPSLQVPMRQRLLREENKRFPFHLVEIPVDQWPDPVPPRLVRALRSCAFAVQVYREPGGILRLSCCRAALRADGRWVDGITWDELQALKAQAGYGDREAVEIYPPADQVVDVANMRHLWVLPAGERMPFSWRSL
jgi:hypothetical protein